MFKKVATTALLGLTLVMSGCGSSDGEAESALETQQMLDNGEFESVIVKLSANPSSTSDYLSLAAAYMGKAGFSLSSIIGIVATSSDTEDNDAFASFIENSSDTSNSQSLGDLKTAVEYYQEVVGNKCLDTNATLSGAEADLCLYVGLSKVSQTAVAISYIADDITVLNDTDGSGATDDKLTASTCAIRYAIDPTTVDTSVCTVSNEDRNVTFKDSNRTYQEVTFSVNGNEFDNLITYSIPRSTAVTNGICTADSFSTRVDDINSSAYNKDLTYHSCPVNESKTEAEITTEDILVSALNDGTESIGAAVSEDVQGDIDEFKKEILEANNRSINDDNTTITIEDITAYLENQNG